MRITIVAIIALLSLLIAAGYAIEVGQAFEEKSINSYMLKTGDTDSNSPNAKAHIKFASYYGKTVAARIGISSAVFGAMVGYLFSIWFTYRKKNSHPRFCKFVWFADLVHASSVCN